MGVIIFCRGEFYFSKKKIYLKLFIFNLIQGGGMRAFAQLGRSRAFYIIVLNLYSVDIHLITHPPSKMFPDKSWVLNVTSRYLVFSVKTCF